MLALPRFSATRRMQNFGVFRPLVASSCERTSAWQRALFHYQRSLVECGTLLELEHAQRIALLFLKRPSEAGQLSSWVRLFHFEGVPTCALMLKALIRHDLWRSALHLWGWSPNDALAEVLVDELMSRNMWEQSLYVLQRILDSNDTHVKGEDIPDLKEIRDIEDSLSLALSDTVHLISDPNFIPAEERSSQSGLSHLVNRTFSMKSQWEQAVSMLVKLSGRDISSQARKEILEVAAARYAYQGEQFEDTFRWIKNSGHIRCSVSLQRTFMRSAIVLRQFEDVVATLEALRGHAKGEIPSRTLKTFCSQFIQAYEQGFCLDLLDRFFNVMSECYSLTCCEKMRDELRQFFLRCALDTTALDKVSSLACARSWVTSSGNESFVEADAGTVKKIDQAASVLLSEGRWKAVLALMERLLETKVVDEEERVVIEAARASRGSWETVLLFFL